jgi:hypothetical protein
MDAQSITSPPVSPCATKLDPPCPVCGSFELGGAEIWTCDRCGVEMHGECFWGRVASLEQWREYLDVWLNIEPWPEESYPCLCPACRAAERA